MDHASAILVFALALGAGVAGQLVARHLRLPSIIPLLALGVLLGPDVLNWIQPRALGDGLFAVVELAVAIILFEGGLNLDLARLRGESSAIQMLVTAGALVTGSGGALAAHLVMGWSWELSFLFGTLVIVTGPTVIGPLIRNFPVRPRLATVLEAEGVLIDPIGAIVAAVTLQLVVGAHTSLSPGLQGFAFRIGFGALAGLLGGFALAGLLRARRVVPEGLENLVALGSALALFALCESFLSQSGILAVAVAGVVVGNVKTRVSRELREFQEHLTIGLIGLLFVLLAADVRLADVTALGWPGVGTVAALMFVVRPLNVWVSTARSELDRREKLFLSWISPRGIVAAAVASLFAAVLEHEGLAGGTELRALVFLTIAVTVLVQGGSAGLVARLLGVAAPGRDTIAILGADELGLALGDALAHESRRVVFLDANPQHVRAAQERGFSSVFGNALDERTLARAQMQRSAAAVGVTPNDEVNSLFAREVRELFGVPETYVAVTRSGSRVSDGILERQASRTLFDRAKDVERWSVRLRHGAARIASFRFGGAPPEPAKESGLGPGSADPYLVLTVRRGAAPPQPMHGEWVPKEGDVAAVVIHEPEEQAAFETLENLGWKLDPHD